MANDKQFRQILNRLNSIDQKLGTLLGGTGMAMNLEDMPTNEPNEETPEAKATVSMGASITGEPVEGYDDMGSGDVVTLLGNVDDATRQRILDYERANKNRKPIIKAAGG